MPEELPLEPDLIKVLAADTRRDILSQLRDRRMTVTELARELDLGKATVHEHLDKLTEAELVERHEDDRLWVYYGLTPRGKRLLNPDRTRFYLALASSAVAALLAGLAVYAFMATGGIGMAGPAQDQATGPSTMLAPAQEEVYAGESIEVPTQGEAEDVRAYLVDEEGAQRLQQGDYGVEGLPLRAYSPTSAEAGDVEATDETTVLRSDAALAPGTYYLYVRSPEGDNADRMPAIQLVDVDASPDRGTWYQALDRGPLTIELTREGDPLAGQARLSGPDGTTATVPIVDGHADLPAEALDRLEPGTYDVTVQPEDRTRWIATGESIQVRSPATALTPQHVRENTTSPVHIHVPGVERLQQRTPTVDGADASIGSTDDGWSVDLSEADPGEVTVNLARTSTTVEIHPSVAIQATVQDGPEVQWTITARGQPVEGAAVYLDGQAHGFTDEDGQLATEVPTEGTHRLTVHRPDGATIHQAIAVDGWRISAVEADVSLDPTDVTSTETGARIQVEIGNQAPQTQPLTLVATVDDRPATAQSLVLPADANVTANLTVPTEPGRQEVSLHADPLDANPLAYDNATTQDTEAGSEEAEADDTDEDTTTARVTTETDQGGDEAGIEEVADGDGGDGSALGTPGKLEPVRPSAAADTGATETPLPGVAILVATLGLAGLLGARARKP